jgi:hypothetical protein
MSRESKIKDIRIIRSGLNNYEQESQYFVRGGTESCIPKDRDAIPLYADEPCVEACQLLYDLNIQTFTSGGHVNGEENATGIAYIGIVYDTLSEENKRIAEDMIKNGIIANIVNNEGRGTGLTISLDVPINSDSLVGEVSDKLVQLASMFQQQDVLYGRKTIDEIKSSLFTKLDNGNYCNKWTLEVMTQEEMQQSLPEWIEYECKSMYTSDGITYFISEDLLNKHLSYIENIENYENIYR